MDSEFMEIAKILIKTWKVKSLQLKILGGRFRSRPLEFPKDSRWCGELSDGILVIKMLSQQPISGRKVSLKHYI